MNVNTYYQYIPSLIWYQKKTHLEIYHAFCSFVLNVDVGVGAVGDTDHLGADQ